MNPNRFCNRICLNKSALRILCAALFLALFSPAFAGQPTPGMDWHRHRRLMVMADPNLATTEKIKSHLKSIFVEDFNRPDGKDLGPGWSQTSHYGVVHESLSRHHLHLEIPDGKDIPWGSATLDLDNPAILGHGLHVGDYFEVTMRRLSDQGSLGVELFDSDQLRVGGDLTPGPSSLKSWNSTTWVPISFDDHDKAVTFDWNQPHVLGVRFDDADGTRATFSYYIDGAYAGSWPISTANKTLDKMGIYVQSKTPAATFEFSHLNIYCKP